MQSILKFHDAIEYCVRAIIEENNISHDRNADLLPLMKTVNKDSSEKQLPLLSQMDFLNATRGKIKHHASIPSSEDTQRCEVYARDFLEQVFHSYFGIPFSSINRNILVENQAIRTHLEKAEQEKDSENLLEALIEIKKAFYLARPSDETVSSKPSHFSSFFLTSKIRDIPEIQQPLEKIIDQINVLDNNVALVMMGIDVIELRRFEHITPQFIFFAGGSCSIRWNDSITPTVELFDEAMNYALDMVLFWQRKGILANRPKQGYAQ